jgi:hypothetical protein
MSGFLFGAFEINVLGWLGTVALACLPLIWFLGIDNASNPLMLLGAGDFTTAWALPVLSFLYLSTPLGREIRERTGVSLSLSKLISGLWNPCASMDDPEGEGTELASAKNRTQNLGSVDIPARPSETTTNDNTEVDVSTLNHAQKSLLSEGLQIMFMDVAIQATLSLSIYLALLTDGAVGYQLTSLQSALPTYGIAYALGLGVVMKIIGPQLIANGRYEAFVKYAVIVLVCAVLLVPLIVGSVVPFTRGMMFDYGTNACEYANDDQCVPFFTNIFGKNASGGEHSLDFTFERAFAFGASIEAVFFVTRATMLTCLDLKYMMNSTLIALVCYIPAICVAVLIPPFGGTAVAFFFAMYVPQIVLVVLFFLRLQRNFRRMLRGEEGSWTSEENDSARQKRIEETAKIEEGDVEGAQQ